MASAGRHNNGWHARSNVRNQHTHESREKSKINMCTVDDVCAKKPSTLHMSRVSC